MARLRNALRWGIVLSLVLATIAMGASSPVVAAQTPIVEQYDVDDNNNIELNEVQSAITDWSNSNIDDVDGDGATIDEIQTLIDRWAADN